MRVRLIPLVLWDILFGAYAYSDLSWRFALRAVSPEYPLSDHELFTLIVIYVGVLSFSLLYTFLELERLIPTRAKAAPTAKT